MTSYARLSPLASSQAERELDALGATPEGVLLPCVSVRRDVEHLSAKLAVFEARNGLPDGSVRIVPVIACAAAIVSLPGLVEAALPRLAGLAYDPAGLAAELGCGLDDAAIAQGGATVRLHAAAIGIAATCMPAERAANPSDVIPGRQRRARNDGVFKPGSDA